MFFTFTKTKAQISCVVTVQLICAFDVACAKSSFSYDVAHIVFPLQDYPTYYEVIKKPIDMSHIQQKILLKKYETVEDMVADLVQMFDNACKYNEPDSLIYKVRHGGRPRSDVRQCL